MNPSWRTSPTWDRSENRSKLVFQQGNFTLHLFQGLFFLEKMDIFNGNTAGKGITRIGMTMEKGLECIKRTKESAEDLICCERCRKGQISAGDALGNAEKIGLYAFFIAGKHVSCPSKTGCHFIGNQENIVFPGDFSNSGLKTLQAGQSCPLLPEHGAR